MSEAPAKSSTSRTEIAIVGGGLAGGLIALALQRRHPEIAVLLIEAGMALGGNHRWSWFDTDLDLDGQILLSSFRKNSWDGYEVRFPAYRRRLGSRYNSLASSDFDAALRRELKPGTIRTNASVADLDANGVTLASGERISARVVIDCRDALPSAHLNGGWQVFMGRLTRCAQPHGLERPIVMDATVRQEGGYRFAYILPLGARELFIEDTYYQDSPMLDRSALSGRIDRYAALHGWEGEIIGGETGVLPVITGGDFIAARDELRIPGVVLAGARGGFAHPLTSYTMPFAVETALAVAAEAGLSGEQLAALVDSRARQHWSRTTFYRLLGRMLFHAARPERRYRVFAQFYRLNPRLIERFYAARSTFADKLRILSGRPPVPVARAIAAVFGKGTPLA